MTIASIETLDITWRQKVENEPIINLVQSNGKGLTGNIYKVENNQITYMDIQWKWIHQKCKESRK